MEDRIDLLIKNIGELVYFKDNALETLHKAAIAIKDGKILDFGPENEILDKHEVSKVNSIIDAEGNSLIPAFVDPHTHLIYSGCRHEEFLAKLKGKEYLELLKEGKGINYTVKLTREASFDELLNVSLMRLNTIKSFGTLTTEIKTGYGLDFETELKILEVAEKLAEFEETDIVKTFLGAHAIPNEFSDNRRKYIEVIKNEMIPAFCKRATFFDIFIDKGAFTVEEAIELFETAVKFGYNLKMHIDELSYTGAAKLAKNFPIVSAEHMEHTKEEDLEILKEYGSVAVLLPGTYFFLKAQTKPKTDYMREIGLPIALGTDHNPGTSPFYSQSLIMALATFLYNLSVEEALMGVTLNAARAINMEGTKGNIETGKDADLLILRAHSFVHLVYEVGNNLIVKIIKKGRVLNKD